MLSSSSAISLKNSMGISSGPAAFLRLVFLMYSRTSSVVIGDVSNVGWWLIMYFALLRAVGILGFPHVSSSRYVAAYSAFSVILTLCLCLWCLKWYVVGWNSRLICLMPKNLSLTSRSRLVIYLWYSFFSCFFCFLILLSVA